MRYLKEHCCIQENGHEILLMGLLGSTAFACDEPLTLTDANQYLKQSVTAL